MTIDLEVDLGIDADISELEVATALGAFLMQRQGFEMGGRLVEGGSLDEWTGGAWMWVFRGRLYRVSIAAAPEEPYKPRDAILTIEYRGCC